MEFENYSTGIKETESTESKIGVSEKDPVGIPDVKEENVELQSTQFPLNGANDSSARNKQKLEPDVGDNLVLFDEISSNVTNGNSMHSPTSKTVSQLFNPDEDSLDKSLSKENLLQNSDDFAKSIAETAEGLEKMSSEEFNKDSFATESLPEDTGKKEECEKSVEVIPDEKKHCHTTEEIELMGEEIRFCTGTDSESMKNPINGSSLLGKEVEEEKIVDPDLDTKINDQNTEMETFLQEGVEGAEVIQEKNVKHELRSDIDLGIAKPEDLMNEKSEASRAESNSFEQDEVAKEVEVRDDDEDVVLTKEALRAEEILKSELCRGRELAAAGDDQMDGDQGSVEIDFMVGDDEHEEENDGGDEIENDDEEEKSELVVESHNIATPLALQHAEISQAQGLEDEFEGDPIEFTVKEKPEIDDETITGEKQDTIIPSNLEQADQAKKDDFAKNEVFFSDLIHDKQLEREGKSSAVDTTKIQDNLIEGQLLASAAAAAEETAKPPELKSLIPTEASDVQEETSTTQKEMTTAIDQEETNRVTTARATTPEIKLTREIDFDEIKNKRSERHEIPEVLQYRKPTPPSHDVKPTKELAKETEEEEKPIKLNEDVVVEGSVDSVKSVEEVLAEDVGEGTIPEIKEVEVPSTKEETEAAIEETKYESIVGNKTIVEEPPSAEIQQKQTKAANETKLEGGTTEKVADDLLVSIEEPLESLGAITKRGSLQAEELKEVDHLRQEVSVSGKEENDLPSPQTKTKEMEKIIEEKLTNGKTPPDDKTLEIVATKPSLVQQEGIKKMHLPLKGVTTTSPLKKPSSRHKTPGKRVNHQ